MVKVYNNSEGYAPSDGMPGRAGIFLVDKPAGPTSFKIVQQIRRALNIKKVGHSGTLDPFASGLLVICAGRSATRIIPQLMDGEKEYEATLQLGVETDTQDPEGKVIAEKAVPTLYSDDIRRCLSGFVGEQLQSPPSYSALKHEGRPLYYYARRGIKVVKKPRQIEIMAIDCLHFEAEKLTIRVICGKGAYIRTLAADIGRALGCGAHLKALRRIRNGPFSVFNGLPGEKLASRDEAVRLLRKHWMTVENVTTLLN